MVQCSKCTFRTKYPGGKKCWSLTPPLCGNCAYDLDQKMDKTLGKLQKKIIVKRFIQTEVIPVLLAYRQSPDYRIYKKTYIRKPSTNGGRLSKKNLSNGSMISDVAES